MWSAHYIQNKANKKTVKKAKQYQLIIHKTKLTRKKLKTMMKTKQYHYQVTYFKQKIKLPEIYKVVVAHTQNKKGKNYTHKAVPTHKTMFTQLQ